MANAIHRQLLLLPAAQALFQTAFLRVLTWAASLGRRRAAAYC
jgi:hypothetical protein